MNRDEIQKLLGGYATGTLNEAERKSLFDAALHDQKLFDSLADEEALRQLLLDPAAKSELLRAVEPAPKKTFWASWLGRPAGWAAIGSLAAAIALVTLLVRPDARHGEPHLAELREEVSPQEAAVAEPQSKPPEKRRLEISEQPKPRAAAAPQPATPVRERESTAGPRAETIQVDALPKRAGSALAVPHVAPADPMSAVATFRQTAPQVSADATDMRAEKTRSGLGLTAMRNTLAAVPMATGPVGVRYEIQQRSDSGMYQRIDPDLPLRRSAPLRLEAETNKPGYLYAFETGPDGNYRQLSIGPTVDAHVKHTVELGEPSPDRKLMLIFSALPQAAFSVGAATEGAARDLDRLRAETTARLPLRQKSANSVYIVGPAGSPLLIEVTLPAAQ